MKNSKKIVFIFGTMDTGGSERVALTYLRQLNPQDYMVTIIKIYEKADELKELIPESCDFIDLSKRSVKKAVFPILNELYRLKPNFVFIVHQTLSLLIPLYKLFLRNTRFIVRMQSTPSLVKKHSINPIEYFLWGIGVKFADIVIAQTEPMRNEGIKYLHIKQNRIIVQHNPVDALYINKKASESFSPFIYKDGNKINALASGRMDISKAFDVLIRAVPKVISACPEFQLCIIGRDGGEEIKLKQMVNDLQISDYVSFLGHQENPYIYYKYCDLYIMSSRREGFPNTLLENYNFNTPTVATRCVPIVEKFIKDGINGYLCDIEDPGSLADAIIKCLKLKRESIFNLPYSGGKLEDILN